jgi:hypothetical protein
MLRKTLFVAVAAILTTLAIAADAKAWSAYYYGYPVGSGGVYRGDVNVSTVAVYPPPYVWYGYPANMGYYYGGYGDHRPGYNRRW